MGTPFLFDIDVRVGIPKYQNMRFNRLKVKERYGGLSAVTIHDKMKPIFICYVLMCF